MELRDERVQTGWLVIETIKRKPAIRVRFKLGPETPKVVSGYGGWESIGRPRRRKITDWAPDGIEPMKVELTFRIGDYIRSRESREADVRELEIMAGLGGTGGEPPLIVWEANAPHDYRVNKTQEWFIDDLQWDQVARNTFGNIFFATGRLVFCQFVEEEFSRLTPSGKRRELSGQPLAGKDRTVGKKKTYVVKRGDTLSKIAARKDIYGDAKKWKKIAKANKIRDPRNLKVGQKLRIP